MSKITFRADDELVEEVEAMDGSKSEIARTALREYLGKATDRGPERTDMQGDDASLDAILTKRIDELIDQRLGQQYYGRPPQPAGGAQDINLNVTIDAPAPARVSGAETAVEESTESAREDQRIQSDDERHADVTHEREASDTTRSCPQCGESVDGEHIYCPNCGEKQSRRVFCDCGDEIRTDWSFCPSCGRRTPAADVLNDS
ncbi:MAG: zinc ribbon domain-containing protein [Halobacteriales archaeon]